MFLKNMNVIFKSIACFNHSSLLAIRFIQSFNSGIPVTIEGWFIEYPNHKNYYPLLTAHCFAEKFSPRNKSNQSIIENTSG